MFKTVLQNPYILLLVFLLIFAIDSFLFILFYEAQLSLTAVLIGHFTILSLLWLGTLFLYRNERDVRFPLLMSILMTAMGPFGAGLLVMALFFYLFYSQFRSRALEGLWPEFEEDEVAYLYEHLIYGREDFASKKGSVSYRDIMAFGTSLQKRAAIEKILRYYRPDYYPILHAALNDKDNSIRIFAATAITTLDKRFFETFLRLKKEAEVDPKDAEAILRLAKHCDKYVHSKLLDKNRERKIREYTIHQYENYLRLNPHDKKTRLALAKLFLEEEKPHQAKKILDDLIPKESALSVEECALWMQAAFDLKEYAALHQISHLLPSIEEQPSDDNRNIIAILHLWRKGYPQSSLNMRESHES